MVSHYHALFGYEDTGFKVLVNHTEETGQWIPASLPSIEGLNPVEQEEIWTRWHERCHTTNNVGI